MLEMRRNLIKNYCKKHNMSIKEFSIKNNLKLSTIYAYNFGYRNPSRKNLIKISECTNGEIQPNDFFDEKNTIKI